MRWPSPPPSLNSCSPSGDCDGPWLASAADVVEVLERVRRQVGLPATIRVDQGTEFVSRDLDLWAYQRSVTLDFTRPGKPTDNAFIEAFNGRFRANV